MDMIQLWRALTLDLEDIELTEERLAHILAFHPEVRQYHKYFAQVLSRPDIIRRPKSILNYQASFWQLSSKLISEILF